MSVNSFLNCTVARSPITNYLAQNAKVFLDGYKVVLDGTIIMRRNWLPKSIIILAIISWSLAVVLPGSPEAQAQEEVTEPGPTISGFVHDEAGPVAGAIVRVQSTNYKTVSADDGAFGAILLVRHGAHGVLIGLRNSSLTTK